MHDIPAERLAPICRRLGLTRILLYTLRHVAIATWKRAKVGRVTIAAMAGHISVKTASRLSPLKNPSGLGIDLPMETATDGF